jgi:hypothetical protein
MKKINAILLLCSMGVVAQAQTTIIDPLTGRNTSSGNLIGYTPYAVLENSLGAGAGLAFPSSPSGLSVSYTGTGANVAEQALFLSPASAFTSPTFAVGDTLEVTVATPVITISNSFTEDFGLAIAAANPVAAGSGNVYNSRTLFDWASISIRPIQGSIRQNTSINGTLTTGSFVMSASPSAYTGLYITWVSSGAGGNVFNLGYLNSVGAQVFDDQVIFSSSSTIGTDIGFYGDLRYTGQSLGNFSNLAIVVPEPTSLAICGMGGLLGLAGWMRRKK